MANSRYNNLINMQRCKEPVQVRYPSQSKTAIERRKRKIHKANIKFNDNIHLANTTKPKDEMGYPFIGLC